MSDMIFKPTAAPRPNEFDWSKIDTLLGNRARLEAVLAEEAALGWDGSNKADYAAYSEWQWLAMFNEAESVMASAVLSRRVQHYDMSPTFKDFMEARYDKMRLRRLVAELQLCRIRAGTADLVLPDVVASVGRVASAADAVVYRPLNIPAMDAAFEKHYGSGLFED